MKARRLELHADALNPPPDRGRLLTAKAVVAELMPQGISERYVLEHVYPRVVIARRVFFYEADVKDWINQQRKERAS